MTYDLFGFICDTVQLLIGITSLYVSNVNLYEQPDCSPWLAGSALPANGSDLWLLSLQKLGEFDTRLCVLFMMLWKYPTYLSCRPINPHLVILV